jgi:CBS domain containing-hemolysin-like protein
MNIWLELLTAVLMLAGNAYFVGAEFSLISVRRSSIELLALKGSLAAKTTLKAMEQVALMIAGAQLGVTVCSLVFGAIGEPLMERLLEQPLHGIGLSGALITTISLMLTIVLMVYLHVVIGEMIPKNLALSAPAKVALILIPPLVFFVKLFKPIIISINAVASGVLRLAGFKPKQEFDNSFNRDEVAGIIKESLREGLLSTSEEQLLSGSLYLDDTRIDSVIIPMHKVVSTSNNPTPTEIERLTSITGFSRFPIMGKNNQLKGYIHLKDVLRLLDDKSNEPVPKRLFRDLISVKTDLTLREAMAVMQKSGSHLAKAVDSEGAVVGVIALEDVIEKLIGEIIDDTWK